jgi:hypothetical protein
MQNTRLLIVAMAKHCKQLIKDYKSCESDLPVPLQPSHLEWMCDQIEHHAESGSTAKLHRWIGFVQAAILAHGILELDGLKKMFDDVKREHREYTEGLDDLLDHLDPSNSFELEIGGEA